jgi:hypothetical protein
MDSDVSNINMPFGCETRKEKNNHIVSKKKSNQIPKREIKVSYKTQEMLTPKLY